MGILRSTGSQTGQKLGAALCASVIALAVLTSPARAQIVQAFDICSDISVPFETQLDRLEQAGFARADSAAPMLAKAAEATRLLNGTNWKQTEYADMLQSTKYAEPFELMPDFTRETVYFTHDSGATVEMQREAGPFLTGKIDMVTRACLIAYPDDYSGETGLMAFPEMPQPKTTDIGVATTFHGERPAPLARVNPNGGGKTGDLRGLIVIYDPDANLGLPAQSVHLHFTEFRDPATN